MKWIEAGCLEEDLAELGLESVAALSGDGGNRKGGVREKRLREGDPRIDQFVEDVSADGFPESDFRAPPGAGKVLENVRWREKRTAGLVYSLDGGGNIRVFPFECARRAPAGDAGYGKDGFAGNPARPQKLLGEEPCGKASALAEVRSFRFAIMV